MIEPKPLCTYFFLFNIMSNSFGNLLRSSRLATFDRSIQQVYKTPKQAKRMGDWGLKRNLPTVIRTPYLNVDSLDTAEHQTPWQSGSTQVMFIRRWKENFLISKTPASREDTESYNIVKMTPAEFNQFLQLCAKKAPEFEKLVKQQKKDPEEVFEYLQVRFSDSPGHMVVGPTYSEHNIDAPYAVRGRVLNAVPHKGRIVGVGGIAAFLPKRYSYLFPKASDRSLRTFYIEKAHIDEEGKPKVVLCIQPPQSKHPYKFKFEEEPTIKPAEMFLTRTARPTVKKEDADRHDWLMLKIEALMGSSSQEK
ncbi:hypothetical protein BY458DRAFT_505246 [Sporodiniella umbellata]|nr:hypothetical protein BY458DRAFT_505246 [Sporodiniella umbellata]